MKTMLAAMALAALAAPAAAQTVGSRIAVLDPERVLTQSAPGKAAFEKLRKMHAERIAALAPLRKEAGDLEAEIEAMRVTLSDAALAEMKGQLADKRTALQRTEQDMDREISEARDRELQSLQIRIRPITDALGKEMGLTAIFDRSGLLYVSDAVDITDTVISRFNQASAGPQRAVPR
jgi:outer membrane protein